MTNKAFLWIVFLCIAFTACDRELMNKRASRPEFSTKGLLDSLHLRVFPRNPLLTKTATIDGQSDSTQLNLDSAGWSREFQIFNDMKIQPGRLQSRYVSTTYEDSLFTTKYIAKDPKNLPLDSFYTVKNQKNQLVSLFAFINYSNSLNTTRQRLEMHFSAKSDQVLPVRYETVGWQKMKMKDTVRFHINSGLKY